jgi:branched-chain amino acid transport system ATP-binding protein
MAAVILSARGLTRHFGGLHAVDQVDLDLQTGEIHALIGPNGAGKTTLVGLLSGRIEAQAGTLHLGGIDISALPAHKRVQMGIAYTFQITSIFQRLTVVQNIALAAESRGPVQKAKIAALLKRVRLDALSDQMAGTLSHGHQRMLEVAMGLALEPRLLILDEPTQGLAADEIGFFEALIRSVTPQTSVLLIEHNMEVVMGLSDRITVLNFGRVLARGTPQEIRANPLVQAAYLGTENA